MALYEDFLSKQNEVEEGTEFNYLLILWVVTKDGLKPLEYKLRDIEEFESVLNQLADDSNILFFDDKNLLNRINVNAPGIVTITPARHPKPKHIVEPIRENVPNIIIPGVTN
jgi:hypothetical protein